ncbi:MFS transporter [Gryllotalpicola protaetiae]|uniref:MFS transporter n=1 Tax=Gryllotalpicola protaetiae TaxID=2419771 RepID=A0A387BP25_9MICO|nr:MFS transporter [Gryllotalpicola protaetiae]AYG02706.1 MFS transporter [Gryllotalpicola protaetiae]
MSAYSSVLKTPGVARIIAAQLTARFPSGMLSLGVLLHIEQVHHTYGAAGLVLAGSAAGQAVAGPLTSRLMGVLGMRPVLAVTTAVYAAGILIIALVTMPVPLTVLVAFVGSLATPPIQPAVRTIYPKLVTSNLLTPLFSLDASAQEIIWIAGPVVITFIATQVSTVLGLVLCAGVIVAGGAWFIASPELGRVRIPRSKRRFGVVLTRPTVLISTIVGLLLIGSCSAVEAGVVAAFQGTGAAPSAHGFESGIVLAIWSLGSLVGGFSFGHLPLSPWSLARRMLLMFAGVALASIWLNIWWMIPALLVSGAGIAPALAAMFAMTSSSVKFSDTAEAFGWISTGQLIGAGIGSAIAGAVIDQHGAQGAFFVSGLFALVGVIVAAAAARSLPDLRGRDSSPIPDTEPIPLQPS